MKFDNLLLELYTHSMFDTIINKMIDDKEDMQAMGEVIETKYNFWKAYHTAFAINDDFSLDEWNRYQKEAISQCLHEYIGMSPQRIAEDFLLWLKQENKSDTKYRSDFSDSAYK